MTPEVPIASEANMSFPTILFLGAGQMAEALIRGVLGAKLVSPDQIMATDIVSARTEYLSRELGIRSAANAHEGLQFGRLAVIAVKPQDVPGLLDEIAPQLRPEQVLVSIAAGVTLATLEQPLQRRVPVVRVMPNTPAL